MAGFALLREIDCRLKLALSVCRIELNAAICQLKRALSLTVVSQNGGEKTLGRRVCRLVSRSLRRFPSRRIQTLLRNKTAPGINMLPCRMPNPNCGVTVQRP